MAQYDVVLTKVVTLIANITVEADDMEDADREAALIATAIEKGRKTSHDPVEWELDDETVEVTNVEYLSGSNVDEDEDEDEEDEDV